MHQLKMSLVCLLATLLFATAMAQNTTLSLALPVITLTGDPHTPLPTPFPKIRASMILINEGKTTYNFACRNGTLCLFPNGAFVTLGPSVQELHHTTVNQNDEIVYATIPVTHPLNLEFFLHVKAKVLSSCRLT